MKIIIVIIIAVSLNIAASGQVLTPVRWSYAIKRTSAAEAVVFFKAKIDDGWHIYSAYQPEGGPIKTSFVFAPDNAFRLAGKIIEPKPVTRYENTFEMDVKYFANSVIFQQKVKVKNKAAVIKGKLEYMVCNDQKCLPPEAVDFIIPLK